MAFNISDMVGDIQGTINDIKNTNETDEHTVLVDQNVEALAITRVIVQRILVPIITATGLFGNIISICVLTQKCMISSTNCYLTTLSVFDLLYLVFSFTLSLNHYNSVRVQEFYLYAYPYARVLTDICSNVSVCLTVTFSLERLIAVCYPMKGRTICTPERAKIITIVVTVSAIVCTAPEFFEWETVSISQNNSTIVEIRDSELAETTSYRVGYNYFIIFTFTVMPLIILSTCNGLLIKSVLAASKLRRQMTYNSVTKDSSRRNGEQNRITLMLIGVVVVFLVCQFPNAALLLYRSYLGMMDISLSKKERNDIKIAGNVVNLLVLINASVNFVLYSVMSTKFRRVFLRTFCRLIRGSRDQYSRTEMTYYNSAMRKSQASPLRYRSNRQSAISLNGFTKRDSGRFSQVSRGLHRSNEQETHGNTFFSSTSSSGSETRKTREPLQTALSKVYEHTCFHGASHSDGLNRVHGIDNDIGMWECVTPIETVQIEQLKETVIPCSRLQRYFDRGERMDVTQNRIVCTYNGDAGHLRDTSI